MATRVPASLDRPEVQQALQQFVRSKLSPDGLVANLSACASVPALVQLVQKLTSGAWTAILKALSAVAPQVRHCLFFIP